MKYDNCDKIEFASYVIYSIKQTLDSLLLDDKEFASYVIYSIKQTMCLILVYVI